MCENEQLKKYIARYKCQLDDSVEYNKTRNIEIDGVPVSGNGVIGDILRKLSDTVGISLDKVSDIQVMLRVAIKRERGPRQIVVQFSNRQSRDSFLCMCKKVKIESTVFYGKVPLRILPHLISTYHTML